jgi:PAP2 superfamily
MTGPLSDGAGAVGEGETPPMSLGAMPLSSPWRYWRVVRWSLFAIYLAIFIWQARTVGVPFDRERLFMWLVAGLAIACVGHTWWDALQVVMDWVPYVGFLVVYDWSRGIADTLGAPVLVRPQLRAEEFLFGWLADGEIPTIALQDRLNQTPQVRWYDGVTSLVYVSHFIVPFAVAAALYAYRRQLWRRYVTRMLTVSFAGVLTFILAPTAPPWMAAKQGLIGKVNRIPNKGWSLLHLKSAKTLIERAWDNGNLVAAVPSLHCAYAFLIAMFFWPMVKRVWLRPLLLLHPLWMVFTVTYGGEHYIVDALVGWAFVGGSFALWRRVDRRWPPPAHGFLRRWADRRTVESLR